MWEKKKVALAALLVSGSIGAGCGNDGGDTTAAEISKAEFASEANAICARGNAEIEKASRKLVARQPSEAEAEQFATTTLVPHLQGQIDQIRRLGAPPGDEDKVGAFLDSAQGEVDRLERDPSLIDDKSLFDEPVRLAGEYGLKACATD